MDLIIRKDIFEIKSTTNGWFVQSTVIKKAPEGAFQEVGYLKF